MKLHLAGLLTAALMGHSTLALAVDCGDDDCGDHGECDPAGLKARCACDDGYVSVGTYIRGRNAGAHCVLLGALPEEEACADNACGPHGVCVVDAGEAACVCDPGYLATQELECVDDPDDDAEAACEGVECGEDSVCMVVSDALTCRCAAGGTVVQGLRSGEDPEDPFGPACSFPLSREDACGPDLCGPYGDCILGQAVICDCDDGYEEQDRSVDGKRHGYCVEEGTPEDPDAPPEAELTAGRQSPDEADGDAGSQTPKNQDPEPDAGSDEPDDDVSDDADDDDDKKRDDVDSDSGCAVNLAHPSGSGVGPSLMFLLGLLVAARRYRR